MNYKLGPYVLDPTSLVISCQGQAVHCDDRIVLLLKLLAERYPEPCETQCLLTELWPKRVVSISSLAKLVSDSRLFFKNIGLATPIIQTVHGRGYRLTHDIAQNLKLQNAYQPPTATIGAARTDKRLRFRFTVLAVAAIPLLAILAIAAKMLPTDSAVHLKIAEPDNISGRILWVDDHPENNSAEIAYFEQKQFAVYKVTSSKDALALLSMYQYQVIISDMGRNANPVAGLHLAELIRAKDINTPYIIYTIMPSAGQKNTAASYGANAVVVDKDVLYSTVHHFINHQQVADNSH
ncbi:response regulator [Rheinheimera maricola]|uniref:Response regulator n=1 Tax=Rheinheimera maricola TaxID=2793282 RepID=A0ABS7X772_9GAMM|nr:response regulator [Rheinheimera maricola]MBZ9611015.1 response regulator [Rheinheimera maricola]